MRALLCAVAVSLCASLCASSARAQAPVSVRYELSSKQVVQGEPFDLAVIVTTSSDAPIDELALPDLQAFSVLRESRASATQMQIRNGQRALTVEQRFSYVLRANDAGKAVIGSAHARVGKATAHAAALTLEVLPSHDPTQPRDAERIGPRAIDRFGKSPPPAFLEVTLDKDDAFVGEQVTGTTELYSQQPLSQWPRIPGLKPQGFLCVSLLGDERPQPVQRTVAGKLYYVYLLNKDALFPLAAGSLSVPAMRVDVVPAGSFFSRGRPLAAQSEARTVAARDLPAEGKPARFSAANVGAFELEVGVRPGNAPLGQPVTLSITAVGRGLLERIELPSWDGGDVARAFPPTKKISRVHSEDVIAGRVTQEMLVQAHREGTLTIPSLSWWTFNPDADGGKGAYVELKSKPLVVKVSARGGRASVSGGGDASGAQHTVARGARPLKSRITASERDSTSDLPVVLGLMCALAGAGVRLGRSALLRRDTTERGIKGAAQRQRLRKLEDAARRADLGLLEQLLLDALASRFGAAVKSTSTGDLGAALAAAGLAPQRATEVVDAIRDLEAQRYAPSASTERTRVAERVRALVRAIEEST